MGKNPKDIDPAKFLRKSFKSKRPLEASFRSHAGKTKKL
jgi:hypothetical protein